ncbi:MAG: Ig-like domain-containing protein, partial [Luteolibacter sp.]
SLNPAEFETTPSPQARYVKLTALSGVLAQPWTAVAEFAVLDGEGVPISPTSLSIHDFDSEELVDPLGPATHAIDGNPATIWHTRFGSPVSNPPHHLTLDLGLLRSVGGFIYTPRQASADGRIASYQVHHSVDGVNWTLMTSGVWPNDAVVKRYDGQVGRRKARCEISGPSGVVSSAFDVTVAFDAEVTDFTAADLQVTGGTVTGLRGHGYYYVARILPHAPDVTVSVPADVASGAALGNRASATLALDFLDTQPPVPVFTDVPPNVTGPFQIRLSFGEPVTGLTPSDLVLTNATLGSLIPSGDDYLLNLIPQIAGSPVGIEILSGAVIDLGGLVMGNGISVTIPSILQLLTLNADEASYIGGGMTVVTDPTAPGGKYLWLPNATGSHLVLNPLHRAEYTFVVPHAGDWVLRGLTKAPDGNGNSFHVEVDGNQGLGTIIFWDIPLNTTYTWDDMGNPTAGDPVLLNLTAGSHTITLYARDDGTRLSQLELQSLRPLATLTTPESTVTGSFTATLSFSENVTGLAMADFSVTGGSVTSLTGSGSAYSLTIQPSAASVNFSLPPSTVVDSVGNGNFASNTLTVAYQTPPPIPIFTGVPANVTGPFQIGLSFDKPVVGLTASDLVLVNARLDSIVPAGDNYLLSITPLLPGSTAEIQILSAAVTDLWGQVMGAGTSISIPYVEHILARNASEASYIGGAMRLVSDASAPHGHYLWLPQNQLAGNSLVPNNRAEFTFIVPHAGEWKLRGLLRAVNGTSDSFYVEVDGNQGLGSVFAWHFNEIVGTAYAWDYMGNYGVVDPVIMNLTAGSHTITVYSREDGSQLDRLELVSVRPFASLSSAAGVVSGPFEATLTFSEAVTGLTAGDVSITGGSVTSVTGSGSSYTLAISPTAESVIFSLPQDSVINAAGAGNIASAPLGVTYRTLYQQWASDHLLTGMNAAQLADDDHDGNCNLLEFAFNLNPAASDTKVYDPELPQVAGLPRMMVVPGNPSGGSLSLQYLRRKGSTGLNYQVQFGSSVTDFADGGGIPLVEEINSNWQRVTVTDPAGASPGCRFGRVVVTSQSP